MQTSDGDRRFSHLACCRGWSTLVRSQAVLSSDMCEYLVLSSAADNLFAGQTAVGKISSCLTLNSISHLVNLTKAHWLWLYWQMVMSWMNLVVDSFQFGPKKSGNQSAYCELYVSQSEEGSSWRRSGLRVIWVMSPCSPLAARLWRDKQRSISQLLLLSKRQRSYSQQLGLLRVSTVYICKSFSIASSQRARQRRWHRKGSDFICVDAGGNLQTRWLAEKLQIGQNCSIEDV